MIMPVFAPGYAAATAFLGALAFGFAYFAVLRRTVELYATGHGILPAILTLGRLAAVILLLGVTARVGVLPLLVSFIGFLLARALALRGVRGTA
jgi:hypothetical protein